MVQKNIIIYLINYLFITRKFQQEFDGKYMYNYLSYY
jgi:hypothetical protein